MFCTGDKVVLVDDKWGPPIVWFDNIPIKNKTYIVRDVRMARVKEFQQPNDEPDVAITLEGLINGPDPLFNDGLVELAFLAKRFRKLDEVKEELKKYAHIGHKQGNLF